MNQGLEAEGAEAPREEAIRAFLLERVADELGLSADDIDPDAPLAQYGLDSAAAVGLSGELAEWLGRRLEPTLLFDHPSIDALARHLST
jgi:acyl carrier protein